MSLMQGRAVVMLRTSTFVLNNIADWCDATFGKRGHWSTPMNSKPWYVRIGAKYNEYEFSFVTEEDATLFILRWK